MKIKYEILVRLMRFVRLPQDVVEQIKEYEELKYWKRKEKVEKTLSNQHYFPIFTEMFGLGYEFYAGKSIVDIGCGPRGSLEWANNASSRVGYDPLAKEYLKLGGAKHKMAYINGYAEKMPFKSESIDIITSINSIDHVSSLTDSVNEIHRVLKKGGVFLLATDIHAHPTPTEPVSIPWDFAKKVSDKFSVVNEWHYEVTPGKEGGLLAAYKNGELYDHTNKNDRYGALILHLVKV